MSVIEQSFPTRCPSCTLPTAVTAQPHCASATCPWLRCTCGAVSTEAGKFQIMREGAS